MERAGPMWALAAALALTAAGCKKEGCLTGNDPDCVVPSACEDLAFSCDSGTVSLRILESGDPRLGPDQPFQLAATGDILLENDQVWVVIEALDHPHYLGPTGGGIVDFGTAGRADDSLRSIVQGTGLLPTEAFHYTSMRTFEEPGLVAVQVMGHLDGFPDIKVATRYELRSCEPGVRVRTEVVNRTPDPQTWFVTDAWYWGGRELLPFTPGAGFDHPSFGLTTVLDAFAEVPFLAAGTHTEPAATYASVACEPGRGRAAGLTGFQSEEVTAMGRPNRVVMPRDYEIFERFHAAVPGPRISSAVDVALDLRERLYDEPTAEIVGRVQADDPVTSFGNPVRAAITVGEVTDEGFHPWTHTVPEPDGSFRVRVPADRRYRLRVDAFGKQVLASDVVSVKRGTADAGTLTLQPVGALTVDATIDGEHDHVLVLVHPADDATEKAVRGRLFQSFEACAPLLGHPHGASPACNRLLVDGPVTVAIPPGRYHVAASAGPFSTLALARDVVITAGEEQAVNLAMEMLPLLPSGALSADFHVHGAASFDSMMPDDDRVRSFLAARLDVLALTEHDTVWSYEAALDALDARSRIAVMEGTESTGHILMPLLETTHFPKVVGHWNAWPIAFDPEAPYRGAPWDELVQPGQLFDRYVEAGWPRETGVIQLNHPIGGIQFGRDFGWGSALELDLNVPPKPVYDGTGNSVLVHTPPGASFANHDFHVQEVMNGTSNALYQQYRAFWFYLLDHGILRGGTANSDSHTLTENIMGTPRTLVFAETAVNGFDEVVFNRAVREGRMIGTNGPVVQVATVDADGQTRTPSLEPFVPADDGQLVIHVSAAPWVPVDEVRIVVNGRHTTTIVPEQVADPLGTTQLIRLSATVPLSELLPPAGDAWIVVEAGRALVDNADLDCDGIPDTGDNNGDGRIDWRDVEGLSEDPGEGCLSEVGPLTEPRPPDRDSPDWLYQLVVPDGYPAAFTNPLVIDRDGDGYQGVAR